MSGTRDDPQHAELVASTNGRITVPAQVRRAAHIEPDQKLLVYVEDRHVVMETRERLAARIRADFEASWTGTGSAVDELIAERREEAAREDGGSA